MDFCSESVLDIVCVNIPEHREGHEEIYGRVKAEMLVHILIIDLVQTVIFASSHSSYC